MLRNFIVTTLLVTLPCVVVAQEPLPPPFVVPLSASQPTPVLSTVPVDTTSVPTLPEFDPNDPELTELWRKIETVQQERNAYDRETQQCFALFRQREQEARTEFLHKFGEKRLIELRSRRLSEEIDVTKINLGVFDFPEINGSTSCSNLARLVMCRVLGVPYQWATEIKVHEGKPMMNLQVVVDEEQAAARTATVMRELLREFGGTHQAYRSLIEGVPQQNPPISTVASYPPNSSPAPFAPPVMAVLEVRPSAEQLKERTVPVDLIFVARRPSADELALAKQHHVELDVRPIALDALVLLVNRKNPVRNLTIEQILTIYDIHERPMPHVTVDHRCWSPPWSQFGGLQGQYVNPLDRERNSGSRELMDDFLAKYRKSVPADKIALRTQPNYVGRSTYVMSMAGPLYETNRDENSIAYSVFQYEHFMMLNPDSRVLNVEGVAPTSETIRQKTYPAVAEVFVVTKKGIDAASPAARLRNFLLSEDGHRLIHEAGFVPVVVE